MAKNIDKMQFTNSKKRDNWEQIKLKDIAVKRNKKNKDSSISTVFSNSALNGIVEQKDFFAKKIANKDNLSSYFIVEKDDFVYNPRISSMAPCGPIHRNNTNKTGIVSPLYTVFRMDPKKCSLDYFEQYFKSSCWHKYMYSIANYGARSDRMNITDSDFFNMEIDAPQLIEQEKISSILTIWDKAIELKEKLIEQKKKQKKGLMQKLLTGEVRLPGFEGKWRSLRILNFCNTYSGGTPSRTRKEFYENGTIPWIKSGELNSRKVTQTEEYITEKALANSTAKLVNPETILLALYGATAGVVAMSKIRASINQAILAIVPNDNCDNNFLFYYLENHMDKVTKKYTQGGQPNLNADIVKKMVVKLPSIEEQKAIANILSNIDNNIELLEKELNWLKQQKKGLMQLLLTGKVRVKV